MLPKKSSIFKKSSFLVQKQFLKVAEVLTGLSWNGSGTPSKGESGRENPHAVALSTSGIALSEIKTIAFTNLNPSTDGLGAA
jgi:hypothetical protein